MSILLPHSDDELFALPLINQKINEGWKINIFFITSDSNSIREEESKKMLSHFPNVTIHQFGRLNKINDGNLKNCKEIVESLLEKNSLIQSSDAILTPVFEGGHVDHDSAFIIGHSIASKLSKPHYCFSLYNAYETFFVRVSALRAGPVQGEIETINFKLSEGHSFLKKVFFYRSQFVILAILFSGLFKIFIMKRKMEVMKVSSFDPARKHPGRLFYENQMKNKIKSLLRLPVK